MGGFRDLSGAEWVDFGTYSGRKRGKNGMDPWRNGWISGLIRGENGGFRDLFWASDEDHVCVAEDKTVPDEEKIKGKGSFFGGDFHMFGVSIQDGVTIFF